MINFGFFPLVSARLVMSIIGLPEQFTVHGLPCSTFVVLAGLMVVVPLGFIVMGGHTSVMVSFTRPARRTSMPDTSLSASAARGIQR